MMCRLIRNNQTVLLAPFDACMERLVSITRDPATHDTHREYRIDPASPGVLRTALEGLGRT